MNDFPNDFFGARIYKWGWLQRVIQLLSPHQARLCAPCATFAAQAINIKTKYSSHHSFISSFHHSIHFIHFHSIHSIHCLSGTTTHSLNLHGTFANFWKWLYKTEFVIKQVVNQLLMSWVSPRHELNFFWKYKILNFIIDFFNL